MGSGWRARSAKVLSSACPKGPASIVVEFAISRMSTRSFGRVLGCPEASYLREVQRERALEHPAIRRNGEKSAQEQLECDALAQASQSEAGVGGLVLEASLKRLAERCGARVLHAFVSVEMMASIVCRLWRRSASSRS